MLGDGHFLEFNTATNTLHWGGSATNKQTKMDGHFLECITAAMSSSSPLRPSTLLYNYTSLLSGL